MKKSECGPKEGKGGASPSPLIDARIKELSDWRGETLTRDRRLLKEADPDVVEEWIVARGSGLGTRRHRLHRGDVQDCREADLRAPRSMTLQASSTVASQAT